MGKMVTYYTDGEEHNSKTELSSLYVMRWLEEHEENGFMDTKKLILNDNAIMVFGAAEYYKSNHIKRKGKINK